MVGVLQESWIALSRLYISENGGQDEFSKSELEEYEEVKTWLRTVSKRKGMFCIVSVEF